MPKSRKNILSLTAGFEFNIPNYSDQPACERYNANDAEGLKTSHITIGHFHTFETYLTNRKYMFMFEAHEKEE